ATFSATLPVAVPAGQAIAATATDPDNNTSEFSLCQTVTGGSVSADLRVAQSISAVSPGGHVGQVLTFFLVVSNSSASIAYNVRLIDTLPGSVTYVSASPTPATLLGNTLTFNIGTMAGNSAVQFSVNVIPTAAGMITNNLLVASPVPDPNAANNSASLAVTIGGGSAPQLQITRSGNQVAISWLASAGDFQLEQRLALSPAIGWTSVATAPQVVGDRNVVRLDISGTARFFRLRTR
ncbi:MAG TPA: DUF11 domain-containing protein, partial [Candidatus Binatia bacterium]|nr:DUF11 domain-containing protein [Candidatus Binatia bacterium]